jgi:phosphoribosyl 1,2-cyclic phosphodiesterase
MRVRFLGVRGSLPVPGPRTERYGGNTSCVEVITGAGTRIVIDAGTGIRRLGKELTGPEMEAAGTGETHILVSHTHWDHIQGLPFFAPLYRPGNRVVVYAGHRNSDHLRSILASPTDAPYFPVPSNQVRAEVLFRELPEGARFEIHDARVQCTRLNHPYVATAYAVVADGARVAYVSDTAPFADILFGEEFVAKPPVMDLPLASREALRAMRGSVVALCEGADLVIYDTMFTPEDYQLLPHFGHSRPSDAIEVSAEAGARALALYHHAPERSDDEIDLMLAEARTVAAGQGLGVIAAYEGLDLPLGKGEPRDRTGRPDPAADPVESS